MRREVQQQRYASKKTIRVYHEPRNSVKDLRTKQKFPFDNFMDGKYLDEIHRELLVSD